MDVKDWQDLASVYRAGADRARCWSMNIDRQQDAEILDAQADRCEEIARERDGYPMVVHDHPHTHTDPESGRKVRHQHKHAHSRGETGHELHSVGHRHDRDPFAPLEPLFPPERRSHG